MTDRWPTFWCDPTGWGEVRLRVFTFGDYVDDPKHADEPDHERCPAQPVTEGGSMNGYQSGHDASAVLFNRAEMRVNADDRVEAWPAAELDGNPTWPTECVSCGAPVTAAWVRQVNQDEFYRATFSAVPEGQALIGREWPIDSLPVGGMYEMRWLSDITEWCGTDGIALAIRVPDPGMKTGATTFQPDLSSANNCTRKGETHKCWCRHGNPRIEPVHVDKECDTCTAGAGSIGIGASGSNYRWHGYVHHGYVVTA